METLPPTYETQPSLAVVTGAGRRLGRAIAVELAHRGLAVGVHYYRSEQEAVQTAELVQEAGQPAFLLQADLRLPEEIKRLFDRVSSLPYRLEVLVNSAAEMNVGNLREISPEEWDATLNLNLRAPMLCAQAAARLMTAGEGVIINFSDAGSNRTWTKFPTYIVSKAGVDALTRLLARALAPGIRVNAIAPGLILRSAETSPEDWERLTSRTPMQRPGSIEDVTRTLGFLLDNRYITGEVITVDGGYSLG